jgi:hypothetical protein
LFVDASGRTLVGTATSKASTLNAGGNIFQVGGSQTFYRASADTNSQFIEFVKGRAADAVVENGDFLGRFLFEGSDGTNPIRAAEIQALVDGIPGTGSMPGRLVFLTTSSGSGSPTERMRLDSSGRLGLGTSSPSTSALLDVADRIAVAEGSAATPSLHSRTDTNTGVNLVGTDRLSLVTAGSNRLFIDASGNVGIGTTSPGAALSISKDAGTGTQDLLTINNANTTFATGLGPRVAFQAGAGTSLGTLSYLMAGSVFADGSRVNITNRAGGSGYFDLVVNGSERLRVDSSGRVLIGTSSSASAGDSQYSKLQIRGNTSGNPQLGIISIQRDEAASTITTSEGIGEIVFTDNAGNTFAAVVCEADANAGSGDYPGRLKFSTTADGASSPTTRLIIKNDGTHQPSSTSNIFIGNTTQAAGTTYLFAQFKHSGTAGDGGSGTSSFRIYTNGDVQNTNNSYAGISDIKLKENVVNANSQWDDLKALQVRNYNFKEETGQQTHTQIGLIAQEVELVSPGLIIESPDRDEEGNELGTVTKSVNYSVLYMKAVKALQEAMERIETLEQRLNDAGIA